MTQAQPVETQQEQNKGLSLSFLLPLYTFSLGIGSVLAIGVIMVIDAYNVERQRYLENIQSQSQLTVERLSTQAAHLKENFALLAISREISTDTIYLQNQIQADFGGELSQVIESTPNLMERYGSGPLGRDARPAVSVFESVQDALIELLAVQVEATDAFDALLVSPSGDILVSANRREWYGQNVFDQLAPQGGQELAARLRAVRVRFEDGVYFASEVREPVWVGFSKHALFDDRAIGYMIYPIAGSLGNQALGFPAANLRGYLVIALSNEFFDSTIQDLSVNFPEIDFTVLTSSELLLTQASDITEAITEPPEDGSVNDVSFLEGFYEADDERLSDWIVYGQSFEIPVSGARPWRLFTSLPGETLSARAISALYNVVGAALIVLLIVIVAAFNITRSLVVPLRRISATIPSLRDKDKEIDLAETQRGDELGLLSRALLSARESLLNEEELRQKNEEIARFQAERQDRLTERVIAFDQASSALLERIRNEAQSMLEVSAELNAQAKSNEQSNRQIFDTINRTGSNVLEVATAVDQFEGAFSQMNINAESSTAIITDTKKSTDTVSQSAQQLADASESIGAIVGLIQDIASQVNLLALNATIESARAGRAGTGFAVVASEVKNLAGQTTEATEDISNLVSGVQDISRSVVRYLSEIRESVDKANAAVAGIASTLGEQTRRSQLVAVNIKQTSSEVNDVIRTMDQIEVAYATFNQQISVMAGTAEGIGKTFGALSSEIQKFLFELQTA